MLPVRALATAVAALVSFVVSHALLVTAPPATGPEPIPAGTAILLATALTTAAVGWLVLRSRHRGRALAWRTAVIVFGIQTFMPQSESILFQAFPGFARQLPAAMVPRLIAAGLLHATVWASLAVALLGRWRASPGAAGTGEPHRPAPWAIALASVLYAVLYFTFGYFVAWRSPAVTAYYGGTDPGSFWMQMAHTLRDTPWLPAAQVVRGLLWTALGLLVLRTMSAGRLEKSLAVGVLFSVVMCSGLLLPNPYMPYEVRSVHLVETFSSNLLFGVTLGLLLAPRPRR